MDSLKDGWLGQEFLRVEQDIENWSDGIRASFDSLVLTIEPETNHGTESVEATPRLFSVREVVNSGN
jgi:hypothetical protein